MNFKTSLLNLSFIFSIVYSLNCGAALKLEDAYKAAVAQTETVPFAESQLRESQAQVDEVKGNFLPHLSAGADYQRQDKNIGSLGKTDQAIGRLTLSQSIFEGGKDKANLNAANLKQTFQEYNVETSKNNLYMAVAQSYYALLSARAEVKNTEKSIELTKQRVTELSKRKKIGKSRNIEVLAAEAQLSVLQAQLLAAIADRRIAKNNFSNVTGLDRDSELDDSQELPTEIKSLKSYLALTDKRPDILGLRAAAESADFETKAASAGHNPSLELQGNYYPYRYRPQTTGADWDAMVVLSIPLYTGGIVQAQVRQSSERKVQAELQLKQKIRDADREIHTAYNNLVSAIEQVKALEKAVAATEQNYREQEKEYRYSLSTNLDVLQSLNTLRDTQRTLDRTRYLAFSAWAELNALTNQIDK